MGGLPIYLEVFISITSAICIMIPAAITNPIAVYFGGGRPIDRNHTLFDGRRILGKGKTWRGLYSGTIAGMVLGFGGVIADYLAGTNLYLFGHYPDLFIVVFLLAFGALFGDMLGSFIKRRLNLSPGDELPGMDQYDFIIGAWLLLIIFRPHYFLTHFIYGWRILSLITVIVLTPLAHRATNVFGYKRGFKEVPW